MKFSIKNFIILTIAGIISAAGVAIFLAPVDLYDTGVTGVSIFITQLFPKGLPLAAYLIILNIPIFFVGYKSQGKVFTIYAVYGVMVYSLFEFLIEHLLGEHSFSIIGGTDLLICGIFGGILCGFASGLSVRCGGVMDGIEVLAVMASKKFGLSVGTFVMTFNIIVYVIAGFTRGSWLHPLYSIIAYVIAVRIMDFVIEGIDRAKSALIVTLNAEEVCAALSDEFKCGITVMEGTGYYSNKDVKVVYIILNRFQIGRMRSIVHEKDPKAYISIAEVADVIKGNH